LPLIFTFIVRVIIAAAFLFYICNYLARFANAFVITLALVIIMLMMFSRGLKQRSIRLERRFIQNLRSREIYAQVHGRQRPQYAGKLLDRDIHISDFEIPENSTWVGQTLGMLRLRNRFGVHVTSILRGSRRINIPSGDTLVFPSDHLQVIGSDEQLHAFGFALRKELVVEDLQVERREMVLQKIILSAGSKFLGLSLEESGIRDDYNVMVVGLEEGQQNLCMINPDHQFKQGDILWVVGEQGSLRKLDAVS
jgi:CPA2 family monovalent cation:H+ antiporter-2